MGQKKVRCCNFLVSLKCPLKYRLPPFFLNIFLLYKCSQNFISSLEPVNTGIELSKVQEGVAHFVGWFYFPVEALEAQYLTATKPILVLV